MDQKHVAGNHSQSGGSVVRAAPFASLSMHSFDRLRLLGFPSEIQQLVRQTLQAHWPRGVQEERPYGGSYEFKLKGNPWRALSEDGVTARRLITRLLEALFNVGWVLNLSADVSCKQRDIDTLIFRRQAAPPSPCDWMCMYFTSGDRIRVIDAPHDFEAALKRMLGAAVQTDKGYTYRGGYELKMRGWPWRASGEETMLARQMVLDMLSLLDEHGWSVYACVDQKEKPGGDNDSIGDADTWHCRRVQGWAPGLPAYNLK
ncbi:Uu.00g096740.m01.CDS01 [Anthostomella pinea]|uniref:Uu.00g096740.m01.CDS01 n=1 Tax=Anthostomella pinea TaxID=933095 RepID=A0AAI8VC91_9PEZI|nr:Uu.00g096740.m01.CDS01 [Anthostomella pinea]